VSVVKNKLHEEACNMKSDDALQLSDGRGLCNSYEVAISHVAIAASFPSSSPVQKKATWYPTVVAGVCTG